MSTIPSHQLNAGMIGMGMIFDETYAPLFRTAKDGIYDPSFGVCSINFSAVATRTGSRAEAFRANHSSDFPDFTSYTEPDAAGQLVSADPDFVCVATPDDRHFAGAKAALEAGKHVLIEKPSVLSLQELDELVALAEKNKVLAKVVYHKLLDPDHKKLQTLVADDELSHVNNGYCTLLEPKSISGGQFAEWIQGRNPGTYVAVHYIKLIDFTFGGKLKRVTCTGQRGLVGPADGNTWDSTQLRLIYEYESPNGGAPREAAFDIHTSWVTPDNFPGYVEQEVQFRFDNGVWNGHSRRRGVECTIEEKTPLSAKISINNHYNGSFLEPWQERSQRGYGIEAIERFVREVAEVEFGGVGGREERLDRMAGLSYNSLAADRQVVAAVQSMEALLEHHAAGHPDAVVKVNDSAGGLALYQPGNPNPEVLYPGTV
ncbi:MAG: Gfo/Idh/MocA family oxidoreductase [Verrucomicrobiales bacterium]|nr:Gfo/Idh/MocA family oxidoreductase [Verrucomicrobiales bacterium]